MTNKKHWILKIVPALAFAAGIIMASIGGIMTLSSAAKLVLFDHGPYDQVTREQCEIDYSYRPLPLPLDINTPSRKVDTLPKKRTEEEITKCINNRKEEGKQRFQQDKKQGLVDGFSALIVGLILVFAFRKREE